MVDGRAPDEPTLWWAVARSEELSQPKPINVDQKPITIAIDGKGQIFLQDQPTLEPDLVTKLQGLAKQGFDERIYVRGDRMVDYGRVASVMSTITSAGFKRVALVTEPATR